MFNPEISFLIKKYFIYLRLKKEEILKETYGLLGLGLGREQKQP
jgi:hypothetical protein